MMEEIKSNLKCTNTAAFSFSPGLSPSHLTISKGDFRITSINLASERRSKNDLSRSYVEATEKRLAAEKRRRKEGFERFDFEPWLAVEEGTYSQTLPI